MRSFILVVVASFVLAMSALVYFWVQPSHGRRAAAKSTVGGVAPKRIRGDSGTQLEGGGDKVALKKFNQQTGELASEFIADEYKPVRGGKISVKNATARFFMGEGKILQIHGETGMFSGDSKPTKSKANDEMRAPTRGDLHDVVLTMLEGKPERVSMTITMNNASFDSENSTIYTDSYIDKLTGQSVPADEVKVQIRSAPTNPEGYDFDGRGLLLAWNERDHRLSKLDITHGELLVIKNPKSFTQPKPQKPRVQPTTEPIVELAKAGEAAILPADTITSEPPLEPEPATKPVAGVTTRPAGAARFRRRRPAVPPPTPRPQFVPNADPPIYRATFHDNVRIVQNGQPMALAKEMSVDFWMRNEDAEGTSASKQPQTAGAAAGRAKRSGRAPSTMPATAPTTGPVSELARATIHPTIPATMPATAPGAIADSFEDITIEPVATIQLTTRPAEESPIYIYWTGPLNVKPYPAAAVPAGESLVTLEGSPVIAKQQSSEIRASRLIYRTEDGSLHGSALPGTVVTMTSTDAHGASTIKTTALEYLARSNPPVAILSGKSTAELPAQADGARLLAAWDDRCTLQFTTLPDGRTAIREANLSGDVSIDHPQIKLDSQRLELTFDTTMHTPATQPAALSGSPTTNPTTNPALLAAGPTTNPSHHPTTNLAATQPSPLMQSNLKQLVASGEVRCKMKDNENRTQTLEGDRLTLLTEISPEGKLVPRTVNVDGSAHAVDADQDLRAGHLAVVLVPSTRPSSSTSSPATTKPSSDSAMAANVDLQSLIAHDAVHVIGLKDGTEAFADTMLVDKKSGHPNVKLVGQPFAKIIDKNNVITGPVIDLSPDRQQLNVDGGGTMRGSQQESAGAAAKPIEVTWMRSLRIDGQRNVVDAFGEVMAKSTDADGTVNIARGDRAQLLLIDVATPQPTTHPATNPSTQPANQPAKFASTAPSTRPAKEMVAKKAVRQALFQDNASVSSTLLDNDGQPLRRMNLYAATIQYDVLPNGDAATTIPSTPGPATAPAEYKKLTIPVAGKMLVEDYRPPSTQPSTKPSGGAAASSGMDSARGATAFQWSKSLVYDDLTHNAVMTGGVIIDHRDDAQKEESIHLIGDTVTAELEPAPPTTQPTTHPTTGPSTKPTDVRYQVRRVTAQGHLLLTLKGGELAAETIIYDPITHILIARGGENTDAVFTRAVPTRGGTQPIRAQEMQWNAQTELPKITKSSGQLRK